MLRIVERPTFTHPVVVLVPTDAGHTEQTMKVRFKVAPSATLDTFDVRDPEGLVMYCREIVEHIGDLVSEDGKTAVEFTDAVLTGLLDLPYVRIAILRHYNNAITKVRQGN